MIIMLLILLLIIMIIMDTATCSGPRSAAIWSAAETPSTWRRFNGEEADVTEGCCKYSMYDYFQVKINGTLSEIFNP